MNLRNLGIGASIWAGTWAALLALDPRLDLANLALLQVLAAMGVALWWPPRWALPAAAVSVGAFNWLFVPPRGSFSIDNPAHALLLLTLLLASWLVALLMARQRHLAAQARAHARRSEELRALAESLRDGQGPTALLAPLQSLARGPVALRVQAPDGHIEWLGTVDANQRSGLEHCHAQAHAFGPGCGHHEEEDAWYLPLRGHQGCRGAALLPLGERPVQWDEADRVQAQALCDQLGLELERASALDVARQAQDEAHSQRLRNTLLAAIAHDHRTPLAAILGAASSLRDQGERLDAAQRQRLAERIVGETEQLARITDNSLQLARLGQPELALKPEWESVEEMVGSVLQRLRQRDPQQRIKVHLEAELPLLRCDAVLVVQLLDNLLDNALRYGAGGAIELRARLREGLLQIAVRDRGPGVPLAQRETVFEPFRRGEQAQGRGTGVGLALCRAIARAHGGELRLRARSHGGSSFELDLPLARSGL